MVSNGTIASMLFSSLSRPYALSTSFNFMPGGAFHWGIGMLENKSIGEGEEGRYTDGWQVRAAGSETQSFNHRLYTSYTTIIYQPYPFARSILLPQILCMQRCSIVHASMEVTSNLLHPPAEQLVGFVQHSPLWPGSPAFLHRTMNKWSPTERPWPVTVLTAMPMPPRYVLMTLFK